MSGRRLLILQRLAICLFAIPSAANNIPLACAAARCGNDVDPATRTNAAHLPALTGIAAVVLKAMSRITAQNHRRTTRSGAQTRRRAREQQCEATPPEAAPEKRDLGPVADGGLTRSALSMEAWARRDCHPQ